MLRPIYFPAAYEPRAECTADDHFGYQKRHTLSIHKDFITIRQSISAVVLLENVLPVSCCELTDRQQRPVPDRDRAGSRCRGRASPFNVNRRVGAAAAAASLA